MPIQMMITTAGLDALVDAQNGATDAIEIAAIGVTATPFMMAPTLTGLPGEIKRITSVSGQSTSATVIHMTGQDVSADVYDVRGIGLYLTDGTLFAVYGQGDMLFRKASISFFLFALDLAFQGSVGENIVFGDTTFLMPPASETVKGVAEIATPAEATAGTDHERIITSKTAKQLLDAFSLVVDADMEALADGLDAIIAALIARTITGTGLVTGGGDLTASRTLGVAAASIAEVAAGIITDKAVTPASLAGALANLGGWSISPIVFKIPGTPAIVQIGEHRALYTLEQSVNITLPFTFPTDCVYAGPIGYISDNDNLRDMFVQMRDRSAANFTVYVQAPDSVDNRLDGFDWIAIGY